MSTDNRIDTNLVSTNSQRSNTEGALEPLSDNNEPTLTTALIVPLTDGHRDFVEFHEGYVRHYISLADTKAATIFGISVALLSYLLSRLDVQKILANPTFDVTFLQVGTSILLLALSTFCAALVISPRLAPTSEGLVFFGAVAKHKTSEDYLRKVSDLSESELISARLQHSYDVSKACAQKYSMLVKAVWFGSIGFVCTAFTFFNL